jgi:hypothetical protein
MTDFIWSMANLFPKKRYKKGTIHFSYVFYVSIEYLFFFTDTVARSSAERYIGIWIHFFRVFRAKTLWFEIERIRKMMR